MDNPFPKPDSSSSNLSAGSQDSNLIADQNSKKESQPSFNDENFNKDEKNINQIPNSPAGQESVVPKEESSKNLPSSTPSAEGKEGQVSNASASAPSSQVASTSSGAPVSSSPTPIPPAGHPEEFEMLLKKKKKPPFLLIAGIIVVLVVLSFLGFFIFSLLSKRESKPAVAKAKLTVWGLYEDEVAISELVKRYKALHPEVEIIYYNKDPQTYEEELNNALAENRGPDIFQIRNDELYRHKGKLKEAPKSLEPQKFLKTFPAVAALDLFWPRPKLDDSKTPYQISPESLDKETKIYGVPFSIDTLALYYNRDLLLKAGVSVPPANWDEFLEVVKRLRTVEGREIKQAGVALGLGKNIANSADIIALLLMQNHAVMVSSDLKSALFNNAIETPTGSIAVGGLALDFYTSFARPDKETYSWNDKFESSLKAFAAGKVAFIIDYAYQIKNLTQLSPSLQFDVAPVPQVKGTDVVPVNYARYHAFVVSKVSEHSDTAWDFLLFAVQPEQQEAYFKATKNPPSLLTLIDQYSTLPLYGAFIKQIPTAKTFFKGSDPRTVDAIFEEMVDSVSLKSQPTQVAIDKAAKLITEILVTTK